MNNNRKLESGNTIKETPAEKQYTTEEKLEMVDSAEQLLLDMGFLQVRVRIHDRLARIEVNPDEFTKMTEENNRKKITESFKNIGFTYTAMDLMGYRTGSMNETLENRK